MSADERAARLARLPKWALKEMDNLRREAVLARRDAATARAENPASEGQWAWLDRYGQEPFPLSLESYEWITVTLPGENPAERGKDRLSLRMQDDGSLEIRGHTGTLSVRPYASNVIRVTAEER